MARQELCILTNMCMIYNGEYILVQERRNPDWPGVTFPGGHVEPGESFVDSVIREVKEETGLDISDVKLCGVKQFPEEEAVTYRYIVFLFKTNVYSGELKASTEGNVFWVRRKELANYVLAEGFQELLEVFENDNLSENYHWIQDNEWMQKNK